MNQNSLNSFLKQNPLTSSYTPSAFLKGFIPNVVIESALQTPVSNISPKQKNYSLSPDAQACIEKSMTDLSLYRYSLPPDLINTLCAPSTRPETLKIFRTKFNAKKEVEILNPSGLDDKKTLTKDQIGRDDSIKTVKHLLDRSLKERDRRQRHKGSGSMYINDLWSAGFEKTIMHATKMHQELKEEKLKQRRPLSEKLDGIKNLYERKMQNSISNQGLEDLQSRPVTTQPSPKKSQFSQINEERLTETQPKRASMPLEWASPDSKRKSRPSLLRVMTAGTANQKRPVGGRKYVKKEEQQGDESPQRMKTEETPVSKFKGGLKVQTGRTELNIGLEKVCVTETDSPETLNTATSPLGASPMSTQSNFMINKQKWDKSRRNTKTNMDTASQVIFGKLNTAGGDKTTSALLKGSGSLSFSQRIVEMSRDSKRGVNKTQETLVGLLEKCDDQLEEKEQYTDFIKGIKRKFRKSKKDDLKEILAQQEHKQRVIEDCIYILNKRDKLRKAD